jgi:hypothetical protein
MTRPRITEHVAGPLRVREKVGRSQLLRGREWLLFPPYRQQRTKLRPLDEWRPVPLVDASNCCKKRVRKLVDASSQRGEASGCNKNYRADNRKTAELLAVPSIENEGVGRRRM